ncbi:MAG: choice-of-anchor D domain-containing protein [Pseudomonadota bacterium]|nr:choice-of-anchor D domain-containing protein [Pseudomonadota bacterium]
MVSMLALSMLPMFAGCTSQVEGVKALQPDIVPLDNIDFGDIVVDYSSQGAVRINNNGLGDLEIDEITINGEGAAAFTLGDVPEKVDGKSIYELPVWFLPVDPLTYSATLTIHSNDEDDPALPVTLTGHGIVAPTPDIECTSLSMDFGTVGAGSSNTQYLMCTNVGDDILEITNEVQLGSGAFSLVQDHTGYLLHSGNSITLLVNYTPITGDGDNGTITLSSNDPDEPETLITMVGNGGGTFEYPVAVVDCPTSAVPRQTVLVRGGDSYDPNGYEPLTYMWTATGPYEEVETTLIGTDLSVQLDLAGEYRVALQVQNSIGLLSAPTVCRIDAIPDEEFHVELVWTDVNDLDLHVLNGAGVLFDAVNDCNYCNVNPDWGALGSADDPTLDLDARSSPPGVENINIESPADDAYSVKVHYYEDSGAGDVTATVNVYLYGVLEGSYSRVMSRNKVWDVAQIVWPEGYVVETTGDLYTPDVRYCE